MKIIRTVFVSLVLTGFLWCSNSMAAIVWDFQYTGGNIGFLDPVNGEQRRNTLQTAANNYGALFSHNATVTMTVTSSEDPNGSTLASAGSELVFGGNGFGNNNVIRNKVLFGNDLNGALSDGTLDFNWGMDWGIDTVGSDQFDFKSTLYHELTHALGFASGIWSDGLDSFYNGIDTPGSWDEFDYWLTTADGTPLIDDTTNQIDIDLWNTHSIGGSSPGAGLFFCGPNAMAANNGNLVGLYSPTTWEDGSSISHIDDENPEYDGLMMLAYTGQGPSATTLSDIEKGMMMDLGYTFAQEAQVPVPGSFGLIALGLIMITGLHRRQQ